MKRFILLTQEEIDDLSKNKPVPLFICGDEYLLCSITHYERQKYTEEFSKFFEPTINYSEYDYIDIEKLKEINNGLS